MISFIYYVPTKYYVLLSRLVMACYISLLLTTKEKKHFVEFMILIDIVNICYIQLLNTF